MNRITLLKIKIKSLAEESRIIRREERKCRRQEKWAKGKHLPQPDNYPDRKQIREEARELRLAMTVHRKEDLRPMQRHAQLAYAFLRGKPYASIERTCKVPPGVRQILDNIVRFGDVKTRDEAEKQLVEWLQTRPLSEVPKAA